MSATSFSPSSSGASAPSYLIYGLGRSGQGVAQFLDREGQPFEWLDARASEADQSLMASLGGRPGSLERRYSRVIATPGMPIDHPDLERLRGQGAQVIGEAELVYLLHPELSIIGVTGTAGKGGTSSLIFQLLNTLGVQAGLGGNFDPPLTALAGPDAPVPCQVAVCELSSFQLERVQTFRPEIAVITNLGVDHLDRHKTTENYHAAKAQITAHQTPDDLLLLPPGLALPSQARVVHFSETLKNLDGEVVADVQELPEGHHPANAAAALLAADAWLRNRGRTVQAHEWQAALSATTPVPGRFETVAVSGGLKFVQDSIATRTLAVQAALERAEAPIAWLVGGRDKGAELEPLERLAREKVKHIVGFGEDGERFARYFAEKCGLPLTLIPPQDGEAAMHAAVQAAAEALGNRGTVLLSPIGTSFDAFKDYQARGRAFTAAAQAWAGPVRA